MLKSELARKYNISLTTLSKLLNDRYFETLSLLGYDKNQTLLAPCVVRKFIELYGEPLNDSDYE